MPLHGAHQDAALGWAVTDGSSLLFREWKFDVLHSDVSVGIFDESKVRFIQEDRHCLISFTIAVLGDEQTIRLDS